MTGLQGMPGLLRGHSHETNAQGATGAYVQISLE